MEPQICAVPEYLSCHFTRDAAWSPEAVAALQTCLWLPSVAHREDPAVPFMLCGESRLTQTSFRHERVGCSPAGSPIHHMSIGIR